MKYTWISAMVLSLFLASAVRAAEPIASMPKSVVTTEAQFTIFADFQDKNDQGVAVYLVNRTGASVQLKAQDGDVYLKLEYETSPGNWSRAQPHAYSWCGNSYFPEPEIGNDEFIVVRGHVPSDGEAATVRYALYGQSMKVHSNAGAGIVNQDEISKAANDAMAVKSGDFEFVSKVATGEIELKNEMDHITDLRRSAINTLARGEFDVESVRKTLMSIVETNDGTYSVQAGDVLKTLTERINEAEEKQPQK